MANDKFEPHLIEFLEQQQRREEAAVAGRVRAAKPSEDLVPVTISHHEYLKAEAAEKAATGAQNLGARVKQSSKSILDQLKKIGVKKPVPLTLTNAVTASLTRTQLAEIAKIDEVQIIRLDTPQHVTCMNQSGNVIELGPAQQDFRADGRGIRVAVLDTGIDGTHPALAGKVVDEVSTQGGVVGAPAPPGSHGTHCAGTIASNDVVFRGVAPQAELINVQVLNAGGFGTPSAVVVGLDQALRRGAMVASLSLGWHEVFHAWVCNNADCILCQAADNAVRLGMTVVVAAGNEGNGNPNQNIRHPGAARNVITVGAVDKAKTLAAFSSIGPSAGRVSPGSPIRLTKPDVCAPGVAITSSIVGGTFAPFSGTSMATPHVAGLVALLLQRTATTTPGIPTLTPAMVKKLLEESCEPMPLTPNQVGYGIVNAYGALMRAAAVAP